MAALIKLIYRLSNHFMMLFLLS